MLYDRVGELRGQVSFPQVETLVQIFGGGNVFLELQRHYDREEEHRNQTAIAIARKLQLPLLATSGVSHATEDERDMPLGPRNRPLMTAFAPATLAT